MILPKQGDGKNSDKLSQLGGQRPRPRPRLCRASQTPLEGTSTMLADVYVSFEETMLTVDKNAVQGWNSPGKKIKSE